MKKTITGKTPTSSVRDRQRKRMADKQAEALITDWFRSRGLDEKPYQIETINKLLNLALDKKEPQVICAACPAAGKTIMSTVFKDIFFKRVRGSRAITLTHGQDILRTQYALSLAAVKPDFDWELIDSHHDINGCKDVVTLPHTIYKRDLSQFDNGKTILVIDEGHQFYDAIMVQAIINKIKPMCILVLTATPAPFVRRKAPMVVVPMNRLIGENFVSKIAIELAYSEDYTFGIGDMDTNIFGEQEVKKEYDFKKDKTYKVLDKLLGRVQKRLKTDGDWKAVSHAMCKTMYVCRNRKQAHYVKKYFTSHGIEVALSDCVTDKKSKEIDKFKNSKTCGILVVIYKGILGFDYAQLCNVVDLSGSSNVIRLFQLLCRLSRKSDHPKVFYKIVPQELKSYYRPIMNAVCSLQDEAGIRFFNGVNMLDMPILVRNMAESDFKEGEVYENVRLVKKHPIPGGFLYDVEIIGMDGRTPVEIHKKITYTDFLTDLQVLPKKPHNGSGPGRDKTTYKDWLANKVAQLPLDIVSIEFFRDASIKHQKYGIYAETTNRDVYEKCGIIRSTMSSEELFNRFVTIRNNIKR